MDQHMNNIWTASAELEMLQFQLDQAHERLVQAMCEAMAAQMPAADVAAAANMKVSELFNVIRKRRGTPLALDSDAIYKP